LTDNHLHIVSFDVPYPPDYGGVSDIFYKIKALNNLGLKIHLHCFEYGRGKADALTKYCTEVNYYKRNTGWRGLSFKLPYIVKSRDNKQLLQNLLKDDYPVLLEGIHCTYFLSTDQLKNKKILVRLHNVEFKYYHQLYNNENSLYKKIYYQVESCLLKNYEQKIAHKALFLSLSKKDIKIYTEIFNADNIAYLPAFIPHDYVEIKTGVGNYCLYHGNLSVSENEMAARWLLKNIFNGLNIPIVIAGKNPSKILIDMADNAKNVTIIINPSKEKMNELISQAQINILPSFNSTGIKIKLLNALFTGRHCVVNTAMVEGTGLASLCNIAESSNEFKEVIQQLFQQEITENEIEKRKEILKEYNNQLNAKQLMQWIY
jgi:hypothetical protein